jgi:hypothetical protein
MIDRFTRRIELIANIAIIVVACLLAITLIKRNFLDQQRQEAITNEKQLAEKINLSSLDIDWKRSEQTLVLALSHTCHFCTESAPFYKKVALHKGTVRLIAVFPQSVEEGRAYLNRLGIAVDEVRQLRLDGIGVQGTPTLLLIKSSGVVTEKWVGKLMPDQELIVLRALENRSS